MVIKQYPIEIEELFKICAPYEDRIVNGELLDAPSDVIDAFNETKKWAWEQMQ